MQHLEVPGPAPESLEVIRSFIADEQRAFADICARSPSSHVFSLLIDIVRSLVIIVALLTGMAYMTWFEAASSVASRYASVLTVLDQVAYCSQWPTP